MHRLIALAGLGLATVLVLSPVVGAQFPGMPGPATFGLCTAWAHNDIGREHGNAANAPPFVWLQEQAEAANQSVEEFCEDVGPGP